MNYKAISQMLGVVSPMASMIPGVGTAISGATSILGSVMGGMAQKEEAENMQNKMSQMAMQAAKAQSAAKLGTFNTNGTDATMYKYGGVYKMLNGGLEKPIANGVTKFEGNTHAEGGIQLPSKNAEVEDQEIQLGGQGVLSNNIGIDGQTFANMAEQIAKRKAVLEREREDVYHLSDRFEKEGKLRPLNAEITELDEQLKLLLVIQESMKPDGNPEQAAQIDIPSGSNIPNPQDAGTAPMRTMKYGGIFGGVPKFEAPDTPTENPYDPLNDATRGFNTRQLPMWGSLANPEEAFNGTPFEKRPVMTSTFSPENRNFKDLLSGLFPKQDPLEQKTLSWQYGIDNAVNAVLTANTPNIPTPKTMTTIPMESKYDISAALNDNRRIYRNALNMLKSTSNGAAANSNAIAALLGTINANNQLYTDKFNREIEMKNANAQNAQQVANQNAALQNEYGMRNYGRALDIQNKISANASNMVGDMIGKRRESNTMTKDMIDRLLFMAAQDKNKPIAGDISMESLKKLFSTIGK